MDAKKGIELIPVRRITGNTNPRNPLSAELQKMGFEGLFEGREGEPSLWQLATSEDANERGAFVKLMQDHDPEFCAWASTFITQGQLQPIEVRNNGKTSDGGTNYLLVFGARRCLAVLYNWCLTGKPKEPVIEAKSVKGNNASLVQRAVVENMRKQPSVIEEAKAIKQAINLGMSRDEVAAEQGCTLETVRRKLKLLELEPSVQKKVHAGTLTMQKALDGPKEKNGEVRPKTRTRKQVEEALEEFAEGRPEWRALQWVLGNRDKISD